MGLSTAGIEYAREQEIDLLITLDCGIKALEQVALAKQYGIDVIICDHHQPTPELPEAFAILNPKLPNSSYPYPELCGAGVAFKLCQAYALHQGLPGSATQDLLDLLVLAIAADIVPLTGENRVLAYFGLQQINDRPRLGIQALIHQSRRNGSLSINDLVFGLGPMINAAGRLGDARLAVRSLLATEQKEAKALANQLRQMNEQRKALDQQMFAEAKAHWEKQEQWEQQSVIVVYQAHWHKGLVGIVASRMTEHYHRPCVVLTLAEGNITGSARSIPGFDLYQALNQCSDCLLNFGGHRYAAGLSMAPEKLTEFQQSFQQVVDQNITTADLVPGLSIAAELSLRSITSLFWEQFATTCSFWPGQPEPGIPKQSCGRSCRIAFAQRRTLADGGQARGFSDFQCH